MLSRVRVIAKPLLRRWPMLYNKAKRAYGYLAFKLGIPHDPEFAFFRNLRGVPGLIVDVGANTGQSARSLRIFHRSAEILSFEPNQLLEPELKFTQRLLGPNYHYQMCGLGLQSDSATLYVPMAGKTPQTPWATADRQALEQNRQVIEEELGVPFTIAEVQINIRRFDDLGLRPLAIKIDVEGFELDVLRGMRETLSRDEPLLMIECNPSADAVAILLEELNYATFAYDAQHNTLTETDDFSQVTNYFALAPSFVERLRRLGVPRIITRSPVAYEPQTV